MDQLRNDLFKYYQEQLHLMEETSRDLAKRTIDRIESFIRNHSTSTNIGELSSHLRAQIENDVAQTGLNLDSRRIEMMKQTAVGIFLALRNTLGIVA